MGIFDNAVPGGSISKPLIIALGALLVGKMLSRNASQSAPVDPQTVDNSKSEGGLLGGLLEQLNNAGHGDKPIRGFSPETPPYSKWWGLRTTCANMVTNSI